jgi:hypothetical protein
MSEHSDEHEPTSPREPGEVGIRDEDLPEDLQPTDDNPLAQNPDDQNPDDQDPDNQDPAG